MDLEQLRILSELKYHKSLDGLHAILKKEAALRADIEQLRQQARDSQKPTSSASPMKNIGADVVWLQWVGRTLAALNIELSQVLARKEALLMSQKEAFGRKEVSTALAKSEAQRQKQSKKTRAYHQIIDASLLRSDNGNKDEPR